MSKRPEWATDEIMDELLKNVTRRMLLSMDRGDNTDLTMRILVASIVADIGEKFNVERKQ